MEGDKGDRARGGRWGEEEEGGVDARENAYTMRLPYRNHDTAEPAAHTDTDTTAEGDPDPPQNPSAPPTTTTLFAAIPKNDIPTLTALLALQPPLDLETQTRDGYTALSIALHEGNLQATRLLLAAGASPHHRTQRLPPLVHAALAPAHSPALLKLLLEHGAIVSAVSGRDARTALQWAAAKGATASVEFLCGVPGVDIEARCGEGLTAVMLAAEGGHEEAVRVLWGAGADVKGRSRDGNRGSAVHWGAGRGDVGVVRFLVEKGGEVDGRDGRGNTALAMASHFGHVETVEVLVAAGADVDARSDEPKGCTPLMWAACANEVGAVKTLIARGADLHAVAADGNSVLDVALKHRCPEAVDVLLEAIGGEGYPKESVAVQLAMARERAAAKALMTTASVMHSHMETQAGELDKYAWVGWVLEQGGDLVKPLAMTKMLYAALREHDVGLVQALVDHGCDVNRKLESVTTPLGFAVTQRYLDIVRVLLEAGADPNQAMREPEKRRGSTMSPFDYAIVHMREEIDEQLVNSLLNSGRCRINQGADLNWTAFSWVLKQTKDPKGRKSAVDLAERMVLSIQNVDGDRDDSGFTLLHIATHHLSLWMVDLLLDRGADIEATAHDGTTPFLLACQQDPEFAMQLLQRGANIKAKTRETNASALHLMAVQGRDFFPRFVEMGLDINEQMLRGYTPLASALSYGYEALALTMMARGAHVDWKTDKNRTALHFAARHGMHAVVEKILEHDVDVNAVDTSGWTALYEACATGNTAVVAQLLDAGADIECPLPNGDKPLHCALVNEKEDVALLLLKRGADFTAIASMKRTPLHMAADYSLSSVADALLTLTNNSTIEAVDEKDWTPLCYTGSPLIVEMLVKAGADVNHVDKNGWTPLHLAVLEGDTEVALELVRAGASLEARTKNDGLTVTERAADLWSWSDSRRVIQPQLLYKAAARREERQRAEEHEPVGGPFEVIGARD